MHCDATFQELIGLFRTYNIEREVIAINPNAAQWKARAVWNKISMAASAVSTMKGNLLCRSVESQLHDDGRLHTLGRRDPLLRSREIPPGTRQELLLQKQNLRNAGMQK